jgi:SM-20-related protein
MIDQILRDLERAGYAVVPDFLPPDTLAALNAFVDAHRGEFVPAKVGPRDNRRRVEAIRGDLTYWLDPLAPVPAFAPVTAFLDELRGRVNECFYLGLKQYECHLACYPPGAGYGKHLDCFDADSSRRLSFVFYLNRSWDPDLGGELVLYDPANRELARIAPRPGTFVCFLSAEFPHEVRPALRERRSLTGWMHAKLIY